MIQDMHLLKAVLQEIKADDERYGSHNSTILALERCLECTESLNDIASSLFSGLSSKRSTTRAFAALDALKKDNKITQIKSKLRDAREALSLAQLISMR
jgi:hypothetical protein